MPKLVTISWTALLFLLLTERQRTTIGEAEVSQETTKAPQ